MSRAAEAPDQGGLWRCTARTSVDIGAGRGASRPDAGLHRIVVEQVRLHPLMPGRRARACIRLKPRQGQRHGAQA
jgi:hypothetical protein